MGRTAWQARTHLERVCPPRHDVDVEDQVVDHGATQLPAGRGRRRAGRRRRRYRPHGGSGLANHQWPRRGQGRGLPADGESVCQQPLAKGGRSGGEHLFEGVIVELCAVPALLLRSQKGRGGQQRRRQAERLQVAHGRGVAGVVAGRKGGGSSMALAPPHSMWNACKGAAFSSPPSWRCAACDPKPPCW